jgi:predicted HAD superfamily Cof-like phosphohydrolase
MNPYQKDVMAFMFSVGQRVPEQPTLEEYPFELRAKLILEEAEEFVEACGFEVRAGSFLKRPNAVPNWPEMIDSLCDLLYVTYGAAVAMGIDLDPFWEAVHASNQAKVSGPIREDGKRMKPEGWKPPDIASILISTLLKIAEDGCEEVF